MIALINSLIQDNGVTKSKCYIGEVNLLRKMALCCHFHFYKAPGKNVKLNALYQLISITAQSLKTANYSGVAVISLRRIVIFNYSVNSIKTVFSGGLSFSILVE